MYTAIIVVSFMGKHKQTFQNGVLGKAFLHGRDEESTRTNYILRTVIIPTHHLKF